MSNGVARREDQGEKNVRAEVWTMGSLIFFLFLRLMCVKCWQKGKELRIERQKDYEHFLLLDFVLVFSLNGPFSGVSYGQG